MQTKRHHSCIWMNERSILNLAQHPRTAATCRLPPTKSGEEPYVEKGGSARLVFHPGVKPCICAVLCTSATRKRVAKCSGRETEDRPVDATPNSTPIG